MEKKPVPPCKEASPFCGKESGKRKSHVEIGVTNAEGWEQRYRIKRDVPLHCLMLEYAHRLGTGYRTIRFIFDGRRVKQDSTADDLGLEDGDNIDAFLEQGGGGGGQGIDQLPAAGLYYK